MFGEISVEKLIEAQKTVSGVIQFIIDNKDSDDAEKRSSARMALAFICVDHLMTHSAVMSLAAQENKRMEREKAGTKAGTEPQTATIQISVPVGSEKS